MTDRELRHRLQAGYQAPAPQQKNIFLDRLSPTPGKVRLIFAQVGYLRPQSWLVGFGVLALALILLKMFAPGDPFNFISFVAAMLPFVAVSTVTELLRSVRYGMSELEAVTRFSLRWVLFTRLGILGLGNLVLILALTPVLLASGQLPLLQAAGLLLCPYCITSFLCLWLVQWWHSPYNSYGCLGIAALVGVCCLQPSFLPFAAPIFPTAALLAFGCMGLAYKKTFSHLEELAWN